MTNHPRGQTYSERVFDHVLKGIITLGLAGVIGVLWTISNDMAQVSTSMDALQRSINVRSNIIDRVVEDHENRIRSLERQP